MSDARTSKANFVRLIKEREDGDLIWERDGTYFRVSLADIAEMAKYASCRQPPNASVPTAKLKCGSCGVVWNAAAPWLVCGCGGLASVETSGEQS
jgi:hypothetical protein